MSGLSGHDLIERKPHRPDAGNRDDKSNDNLEPRRLDARYATYWGRNRVQRLRRTVANR